MNWWKTAKLIDDFSDRNLVNHSIDRLEKVSETLLYCAELIYQTGRGARKMVSQISASKIMSTYPDVVDMLDAANRIALDSPKKFAELCEAAAKKLQSQAMHLKDERSLFIEETNPNRMKGWVDEQQ
jgi:hypothetical protein